MVELRQSVSLRQLASWPVADRRKFASSRHVARISYVFTSYSLESELGLAEVSIDDAALEGVRKAAAIDVANWQRLECWPLTQDQARDVGNILGQAIDGSEAHYFVESREP